MSQYIGKTISLISNKGLRYVGLLDNINSDDATVALKSVRLFGTEGRMAQNGTPNLEVLPGNDVYDYVVFRGSDVKDLSVLDTPIDSVKPEPYQGQYYPANAQSQPQATSTAKEEVSASAPQPKSPEAQAPQAQRTAPTATKTEAPTPSQSQQQAQPRSQPEPARKPAADTSARARAPEPAQPQPQHFPQRPRGPAIPQEEFDFESANAQFERELETQKSSEDAGYNKSSSFFDNISSSNENRSSMRWAEEKNLNLDTFGETSIQRNNRGGRGRGRGRGGNWRGGRGNRGGSGGRGRGRSDYDTKPEWA